MEFAAKLVAKSYMSKIKKEFSDDDEEKEKEKQPIFDQEEQTKRETIKAKDRREFEVGL
jgi:hypothetical protein